MDGAGFPKEQKRAISDLQWQSDMAEVVGAIRYGLARRRSETLSLLCAVIEDEAHFSPGLGATFETLRENATDWAETASPAEIEAVTAAGIKQIEKAAFAISARKRIMVTLWNSLAPDDRAAFLKRVAQS